MQKGAEFVEYFRAAYSKACQKFGVGEDPAVVSACTIKCDGDAEPAVLLNIVNTVLGSFSCNALGCGMASAAFRECTISAAYVGDTSIREIIGALVAASGETLQRLDLSSNGLRTSYALASGVVSLRSLRVLCLAWNKLGLHPASMAALSAAIISHSSLEEVDLRNNLLGSECSTELCRLIEQGRALKTVFLDWNNLGNDMKLLANALTLNNTLTHLGVDGNNALREDCERISQKLQVNKLHAWKGERETSGKQEMIDTVKALKATTSELEKTVQNVSSELERERNHVAALRQQNEAIAASYNSSKLALEGSLAVTEKKLSETMNTLGESQTQLASQIALAHKCEETKTLTLQTLEKEKEEMTTRHRDALQKMQQELTDCAAQSDRNLRRAEAAEHALEQIRSENAKLAAEITEKRSALISLESKTITLGESFSRKENDLSARVKENQALEEQVRTLNSLLAKERDLHNSTKLEADRALATEKARHEDTIADLKHKLERCQSSADEQVRASQGLVVEVKRELEQTNSRHEKEVVDMSNALSAEREQVVHLQVEAQRLQSDVALARSNQARAEHGQALAEQQVATMKQAMQEMESMYQAKLDASVDSQNKRFQEIQEMLSEKASTVQKLEVELITVRQQLSRAEEARRASLRELERRVVDSLRTAQA